MLALTTLDLFLSINQSELLDEFILTLFATPQLAFFLEKYPTFKQVLLKRMPLVKQRLENVLKETHVPKELATEFYLFQQCQLWRLAQFRAELTPTVEHLGQLAADFYPEARLLAQAATFENAKPDESFQLLFVQRWRISLTLRTVTLHRHLFDQERETLLDELQRQMAISGALSPLVENETSAGRLWDMAAGQWQRPDYQQLVHYSAFLQTQPELRALADQLGRSRKAHAVAAPDATRQWVRLRIREPAVQPEEVSGIHQSDDLLRLLPAELATLGIDELEYEFYRRLLEKRLLTYRLQGEGWREREMHVSARSERLESQPRGPFIVCVDTSGSMGGFNEQCAKAFCLALMRIALADNRRCFITLFSTGMVSYELSATTGLEQATRFLGQRFSGGTDLNACIAALSDRLDTPDWWDADAVVISDFIAQQLPEALIARIKQQQRKQLQRFHAVALSSLGKPSILKIFDHIWYFDTGLKNRILRRWHRTA
ncbi:ATPase RavA stimulator ViaA [Acerihabitans sp. TG2]|uniref:ATPase RavA stimulator ViaA n=1 Tax=Acerihabitans sp. TG2 TaxID=3096008 RepID=UPI002B22D701|nr:ATPase RavA stimulator ViaA [Acerihabitans sp. TG2]MEA9393592.1 ATPase RavA stimulator ViaA [Acerihabitans sp. TG2]